MMDNTLRTSAIFIERYFKKYGMAIYQINPEALVNWSKVYQTLEKSLKEEHIGARLDAHDTYFEDESIRALGNYVSAFDSAIQRNIYSVIRYEPNVMGLWSTVRETLNSYIKDAKK